MNLARRQFLGIAPRRNARTSAPVHSGNKALSVFQRVSASLKQRHLAGYELLDMDAMASVYYNEATGGPMHCCWRFRLYCRGFFGLA